MDKPPVAFKDIVDERIHNSHDLNHAKQEGYQHLPEGEMSDEHIKPYIHAQKKTLNSLALG